MALCAPSTAVSSTALTVTVCAVFQLPLVNVSVVGASVTWPPAEASVTVTSAVGREVSLTVNESPAPPSVTTVLTFPAANYNAPQTVSVAAVNDASKEGVHSATVTFSLSSSDPVYNGLSVPSKTVSIVDND